jgi:thiol-disulfide isomerase/thioredoxin
MSTSRPIVALALGLLFADIDRISGLAVPAVLGAGGATSAAAPPSAAGGLAVGDRAPPLVAAEWLNVEKPPAAADLAKRVVMVEFWGTWCAPCVRAMPHVQELHARYRERGLTIVALTYEPPSKVEGFLKEHSYTMPVACDTAKTTVAAYGISSWPSTFVIDRDGRLAYVGGPYEAEPAIEKALGLESGPGPLLTAYLDALRDGDLKAARAPLQRLYEKATADFAFSEWAAQRAGTAAGRPATAADGGALLEKIVAAVRGKKADAEAAALKEAAATAPAAFDLRSWVAHHYGSLFPLEPEDVARLLKAKSYEELLTLLVERNPTGAATSAALRDKGLKEFCAKQKDELGLLGRKAVMAERFLFADKHPRDNEAFWNELAVSGVATSSDKKEITGILLAGAPVGKADAHGYADRHFALRLLAEAIAKGKSLAPAALQKEVAALRRKTEAELDAKY